MSTSIEWTDLTWNPGIYGCRKVSEACDNCYAMGMAHRLHGMGVYPSVTRRSSRGPQWTGEVVVEERPVRLGSLPKRAHKRVFVTSMSDVYHVDVPFAFINQVFGVFKAYPHLTFQVLTKRTARAVEWWHAYRAWWETQSWDPNATWPANVWIGATVETQRRAEERIPHLLRIPAGVRFLSCEPLLGPLNLSPWLDEIGWVITGGESGSRARPTDPRWFRSLRDQCNEAGVPFFFKQWGRWVGEEDMAVAESRGLVSDRWYEVVDDGGHPRHHWPQDEGGYHHRSFWVGPKGDPKTLDGVVHRAFPEP